MPALARAAQRLGVRIRENCAVRTLETVGRPHHGRRHRAAAASRCAQVCSPVVHGQRISLAMPACRCLNSRCARRLHAPTRRLIDRRANSVSPGSTLRRRATAATRSRPAMSPSIISRPTSFRYATKFSKLLKASAKDVRLHAAAPKDYPVAWGMRRRWSADEQTPVRKDARSQSRAERRASSSASSSAFPSASRF